MAVEDFTRRIGPVLGDGAVTQIPFDFKLLMPEDVAVTVTDVDGVTRTLALDTDYTLAGVGDDEGGAINLSTPLDDGLTLWVLGDASFRQAFTFYDQGPYFASDVTDALDRLTILSQQLREMISRALVIPVEYGVVDFGELVADITVLSAEANAIRELVGIIPQMQQIIDNIDAIIAAAGATGAAEAAALAADQAVLAADQAAQSLAAINAKITISTDLPSGGSTGDIWFRVAQ